MGEAKRDGPTRLQEHVGVEWQRCHQIDDVDGRLQKIAFVRTEISDGPGCYVSSMNEYRKGKQMPADNM